MEGAPLKQVGRYDLLEVIGRGGAAVVYLARQADLQRHVALKELAPFHAADETFAQRFVEESRLAGAMNHANVVTVHEFFEDGGVPYIAMEYLPHGSLRQYIDKLSLAQMAGVLEGVLAGLSHGEAQGIVHRDLKPENLLVSLDGRVKIADFGVARAFNNAATRNVVTATGSTIGTPAYMSPEQALGSELTSACDLYSLGVIAWELLVGHVPFTDTDTPVAVLYRHVHEEIVPVRSLAPDVDVRVERWVQRMLAKAPGDRFRSADEAWYALEDIVLELLGPRWRRDARLAVDDTPTVERAPLQPAPFTDSGPVTPGPIPTADDEAPDDEAPDDGAADVDEPPAPPPPPPERRDTPPPARGPGTGTVGSMATVAPAKTPKPSYTTIMRRARRHRDLAPLDAATTSRWRRRLAVLGILAAMAAAALAGVLIADGHHGPSGPTPAEIQGRAQARLARTQQQQVATEVKAATTANGKLATIIERVGPRRSRDVTRLGNAHTPASQMSDARAVARDYRGAAGDVGRYDTATGLAGPLRTALNRTASAYDDLAAAVSAESTKRFDAAEKAITAREGALRKQVSKLSAA